jgi:acetolactate synthase-1/2/3 large subunit
MMRAWSTAMDGQRGPVVLIVSEDVWHQNIVPPSVPLACPEMAIADVPPKAARMIDTLLAQAARPVLVAGGTDWSDGDRATLLAWAEAQQIPVVTSYRRRDLLPAASPAMCGELGIGADPALIALLSEADLLVVAGMRLGEINTFAAGGFAGYGLLDAPAPKQKLVHIHPDCSELNRVFRADLAVAASPGSLFFQLDIDAPVPEGREAWRDRLRAARQAFATGKPGRGPVDLRAICQHLRATLPEDTVFAVGAGAYAHWPQRYLAHARYGTCLGPKSGAMGYGLPAAIGAATSVAGIRAVAIAGDGCFLMHGEELATAVLYQLPVLVIVINNSSFGAIAASQERMFGHSTGTSLAGVDFAGYARAMGAVGFCVNRTEEFASALDQALAATGPALIEIITGPDALKP